VLTSEYPTRTDGVRVRFVFKICSGDNKALGALVKHRLGMVCCALFLSPICPSLIYGDYRIRFLC
jgi:hypothetical protein